MTVPGPPLRATVNPGTSRSASPSVVICRASRSARDSVLTLSASSESGVSTYDAVTVSDSSTALTARRSSSSVLGDLHARGRRGQARGPRVHLDAGAGRQIVDDERPRGVGHHRDRRRRGPGNGDLGAGHGAAVRVDDAAAQRVGLSRGRGQ